ncbi:MAG: C2 family cysteine protease, partial [Planctomycetota bacterium]|nr:C2 family cysteine protease [Planctomycetota bacterium]
VSILEALEERLFLSADNRLAEWPSSFFAHIGTVPVGASPKTGAAASSTDDYGNTLASAWGVALDSAGSALLGGQINYASDVDVFYLVPAKDGRLSVKLTAIVSKRVSISGDLSAWTDLAEIASDANPVDNGATVSFDVTAGTKYYIRVASINGQSGKYTLGLSGTWVTPPPVPPPPPPAPGSYTPGPAVTWQVQTAADGLHLVVLGTDGGDAITGSKASGSTVVYVSGVLAWTSGEVFSNVQVYGFGGNDLLVSVSGAAESVWGGSGFDSFWCDAGDQIGDAEATETAAKSVHIVGAFYQPLGGTGVSLELAGQNLSDPLANGGTYANFSSRPLFANGPQYNDVIQGGVGDCYFLAALSSLAASDPDVIRQMVAPLGDGTYAVRYFRAGQEVYVRVDGDLPAYYGTTPFNARLTPDGEIWVAIAEKAYAEIRTGANTYASLAYGWMDAAYQDVTGQAATRQSVVAQTDSSLVNLVTSSLSQGHAISAASLSTASGPIIANHAYGVQAVTHVDGTYFVTVYNVWGRDGVTYDANPGDGLVTLTLAAFRSTFSTLCTSAA